MGVFNQDFDKTVITANVIEDAIKNSIKTIRESRPDCYPTCYPTEDELERIIGDIVGSIYYRCKVGDIPLNQTWRFDSSLFGVHQVDIGKRTYEYNRITNYIERRFIELGFGYSFDIENHCIVLSIPLDENNINNINNIVYNVFRSFDEWDWNLSPGGWRDYEEDENIKKYIL